MPQPSAEYRGTTTGPMTSPTDKPPSLWEDCLELFYAPGAVFARRRDDPAFGGALLLLFAATIVLGLAFKNAIDPLVEADMRRGFTQAMKQNPRLSPDMMQLSLAWGKKFWLFGAAAFALILPPLLGLVVWLAGKLVDAKAEVGHAMMVATYAMLLKIPETVLNALQALLLPEASLRSSLSVRLGPARFLDPDTSSQLLMVVLARVDLFTLWITAVIAIGISETGQVSRAKGWLAGGFVWLIGALPGVWGVLRQG
jgi:Yip1-like protein